LNILSCFDAIFCSDDYVVPDKWNAERKIEIAGMLKSVPNLRVTKMPPVLRKPSSDALRKVLESFSTGPDEAVLLGDNLTKDVLMSQNTGVFDCWAEFGTDTFGPDVGLLVSVTAWSDRDVEKFFSNKPELCGIAPSYLAPTFLDFVDWIETDWQTREYPTEPIPVPEQLAFSGLPLSPL
jgi:hypothetical protein